MEKTGSYIKRARDLEVYKRAYAVSLDVHGATLAFPKMEQYALADRMRSTLNTSRKLPSHAHIYGMLVNLREKLK
ncbi:four helix bundle protein [Mesorhizobium onobrychidis]|uniref:Four helix bundle protein n=1 Tax=Mesorhizobium onobrychidis TaxID=2775404 RepID=A0ABY5R1H0_9HYPH|nr:four helix bundle protein [Mesorhizobium onobrychidis]UVC16719.1 four helix bundle protein [Mesorhizobium onobrychidis]